MKKIHKVRLCFPLCYICIKKPFSIWLHHLHNSHHNLLFIRRLQAFFFVSIYLIPFYFNASFIFPSWFLNHQDVLNVYHKCIHLLSTQGCHTYSWHFFNQKGIANDNPLIHIDMTKSSYLWKDFLNLFKGLLIF